MRYFNDAAMALNDLYEAAENSEGACEVLRKTAADLVQRAGDWHRMKYSKK